ncbi:MAG: PAS domain-containing protein, partial [Defluviitaleaceae bacterium]|nr:PAS domain-containing protein [Defluviitaleaceae bacterium]
MKINLNSMSAMVKRIVPVLVVVTVGLFFVLNILMARVTNLRDDGALLTEIGNDILATNNNLIKYMKRFVIDFDSEVLKSYETLLNSYDGSGKIEQMKKIGLTSSEQNRADEVLAVFKNSASIEKRALDAYNSGNLTEAAKIIQSREYYNNDNELERLTMLLLSEINGRVSADSSVYALQGKIGLILIGIFFILSLVAFYMLTNWFVNKTYWYEDILNNIPLPISVTDMDRKCTFINKPVENMLGVRREDVLGKSCASIWNAGICNTQNCGIECMLRGIPVTQFNQAGFDFQVDVAYLTDNKNKKVGHIEVVQNISQIIQIQKEHAKKMHWYENILDNIPLPISVTDMDRKCT